ncbi:uncharacterized protein BP5553_04742 [Venustampulla echinocandica]|uniref:HTH myb-type domain-containing protein n=1 Tax=Venustampulla echinocandica TaxID=2656787 RepID=A0A370TP53_9HELO|nr:uncharacterized protein BP5553_04742 [Venustampulla echinocandica]RDL37309.1 hypothetical protein BP5553_04742 [Venustampulla echinocandica]
MAGPNDDSGKSLDPQHRNRVGSVRRRRKPASGCSQDIGCFVNRWCVTDIPIKYESPYYAEPATMYFQPSSAQKRPNPDGQDGPEKRQRIEPTHTTAGNDDHMAALLAQATAAATQQFQQSSNVHGHRDQGPSQSEVALVVTQDEQRTTGDIHGFTSDPNLYMRILSLPILESLSTQILSTLAQGPYPETIRIVTEPESELGQAYTTLKSLFDQTKKIYNQQDPFLSADSLNIREPEHRATIRTTNLATFVSSVFGGQDVGFYELNDCFIDTFTPEGEPLGSEAGRLFLNLKTQMYLSASQQEEQDKTKEDILDEMFPHDLSEILSTRHPNTTLCQSEIGFVNDCRERKEYLMNAASDPESIQELSEMFDWEDFLRDLSTHLNKAYGPLLAPYMKRHALTAPVSPRRMVKGSTQTNQTQQKSATGSNDNDFMAHADRAAQEALQSLGVGQAHQQHNGGASLQRYSPPTQNGSFEQEYGSGNIPYHTQSAPTQVLYEKARQAAISKSNPGNTRRPGLPSQRRPWSTDEENALMAGLDQVKGPHWSQILNLYGPKGTVSEILKDRNQVQLKDKARNLKLFFLKSNIEVPYYLQSVTGELKTRAPSQAARKEAEERAKLASDEEQARFHGIMALAGGMQDHSGMLGQLQSNHRVEASDSKSPETQPGQSMDSPEELHVVDPANQVQYRDFASEQMSEDEQFRQRLIAATASATVGHTENGAVPASSVKQVAI